jgi:Type II secretion system (T2SS), protein M subtype b
MIQNGDWQRWKKWTGISLAFLLFVDLALASFLWAAAREGPQAMRARRDHLAAQAKLLRADVDRGEKVRASLPQAGRDCEAFYHQTFLDASTGYSQIEGDLSAIASKAGVRTSGITFKQKEIKDRGVVEISIGTSVEADYPAVIQFINGLERSKNFYLLDGLHLASATAGAIRLQLELHTYFRI